MQNDQPTVSDELWQNPIDLVAIAVIYTFVCGNTDNELHNNRLKLLKILL